MRRQVYEWKNIMPTGETVILNNNPILTPNNVHTVALPANIPVDIFIGGIRRVGALLNSKNNKQYLSQGIWKCNNG